MNECVRKHVAQYCEKKGWETDESTIIEVIQEGKRLSRVARSQRRWWNEYQYIVDVDGMLIGYVDAETNRDMSVQELGYDFDPSLICEIQPVDKDYNSL